MSKQLKLMDREWRAFFIKDLFTISTGSIVPREQLAPGRMPRITATEQNNGVDSFTAPLEEKSFRTNADCLSISFLGAVFYQSNASSFDMKIHSLNLKNKTLGKHVGLFVATELRKQFAKFSYGNQLSSSTLLRQKFQLPSIDGSPDWNFMSAYMRQEEKVLMKEAISRLERQLAENHAEPVVFKGREWRAFKVSEIFPSIQRGKRIKRADHVEGDVPYVSASALNNGVDGFIGNREGIRVFANCLSLANSGSVGSAFFHPYAFVASDHVTKLEREGADRYIYLFFPPVFSRMAERYSFNHEISDARITRERIMLPVTPDGTPDWAFMSAYMQQLEQKMLREALAYFKEKIR